MHESNQPQAEQEIQDEILAVEQPEASELSAVEEPIPQETPVAEEPQPQYAPPRPHPGYVPPQSYPPYHPYARPYYPYGSPVRPQPRPQPVQKKESAAPKKKSKGSRVVLLILLAVAIAVASSITTGIVVGISSNRKIAEMQKNMDTQLGVMQDQINSGNSAMVENGQSLTPGQVYAQNSRAVVSVTCTVRERDYYYGGYSTYESAGTGFIVSQDGYIVSNCHVVAGSTSITVTMMDGQEYRAELIGADESNDVSLLKIQAEGLPCVTLGSSEQVSVGDQVVAIGNQLGEFAGSLTVGYVSGKDRVVNTDGTVINMLQTDVAINSGNSGGPLFNMKGEVIGITTAKVSGDSGTGALIEGLTFAIPIDDVKNILLDLGEVGYVKSAFLGVMCRDVSAEAIRDGLPAGVYIEEVEEGSCAEAAGIQRQDIIVALGDYTISNSTDLTRALRKIEPGTETTVVVYRAGQELELTIVLDEKPVEDTTSDEDTVVQEPVPDIFSEIFGDFFGW